MMGQQFVRTRPSEHLAPVNPSWPDEFPARERHNRRKAAVSVPVERFGHVRNPDSGSYEADRPKRRHNLFEKRVTILFKINCWLGHLLFDTSITYSYDIGIILVNIHMFPIEIRAAAASSERPVGWVLSANLILTEDKANRLHNPSPQGRAASQDVHKVRQSSLFSRLECFLKQ